MTISPAPYTLILLRHGESDWNARNLFTGWVDVDLTEKGRAEAARGGELLAEAGLLPDVVQVFLKPDSAEEIRRWAAQAPTNSITVYRDADAALG